MMETQRKTRGKASSLLATVTAALVVMSGLVFAPTVANAADPAVQSATLDWGVKASFRNYIKSPIAKGTIENLGTTTGQFNWASGTGTAAADGSAADVSFGAGNGMHFLGHEMQGGNALDMRFTNPRIKLTSATTADLYLDVKSRKFEGMTELSPDFFEENNVRFATVTLPAPTQAGKSTTWTNAATVLAPEGVEAFGGFYQEGDALDPITLTVSNWAPTLDVFLADGTTPVGNTVVRAGDKLVVKGTDFDPAANVGGRGAPIPNTLPQGNYIVFGNFADVWKPSSGAAGATRKVGSQGWALTAATVDAVPAMYQQTIRNQWIDLGSDGSFTWQLTVNNPDDLAGGKYGIYSYGAGGMNNASQELFVPVNYDAPTRTTTTLAVSPASPVTVGTVTELKATVAAAEGTPAGTVAFFSDKTQLGQPQALSGGTAEVTVSDLPAGAAKLKAVFTSNAIADFTSSTSAEAAYQVNKIASTTTLAVSPDSPVVVGAEATLKATVAVAEGSAAGAVTFFNGATQLGAPQAVADGAASVAVSDLPAGTAKLKAVFTPADGAKFDTSTSAEVEYQVNKLTSSVSLKAANATPAQVGVAKTKVSLDAAVTVTSAAEAVGTVTFFAGGTQLGTPQSLKNGAATLEVKTLSVGPHNLTAKFAPADSARIEGSTSDVVALKVTGGTTPPAPKYVFTDVKEGDKFFKEIAWMGAMGLSTGNKQVDGTYKYLPADSVSRQAMAAFLYRESNADFKAPKVSPFADVNPGDKFYKEITWMQAEGISTGTRQPSGKPLFKAQEGISREAIAAFLYRINKDPKATPPAESPFVDVNLGDKFYKEIAWMYTDKLSTGTRQATGKPRFEAKANVSRMAMAAFMYRRAN